MPRPVCPCPYHDPLLWTQAQNAVARRSANMVGLLGMLVEKALHPENFEKDADAEKGEGK